MKKSVQIGSQKYDFEQIPKKRRRDGPRASKGSRDQARSGEVISEGRFEQTESPGLGEEEGAEASGFSFGEVLAEMDTLTKYTIELRNNRGMHVLNGQKTVFLVQDFSTSTKTLQTNHYCVLKRKCVRFTDQTACIWCCSCNVSGVKDFDSIPPIVTDSYEDHNYFSDTIQECQVWELSGSGRPQAVVLCDLNVGVVRCWQGNLECLVCEWKECCHIKKLRNMLSDDSSDVPDVIDRLIIDMLESQGIQPEHNLKCLSSTKIPFNRSTPFPCLADPLSFSSLVEECLTCGTATDENTTSIHLFTCKRVIDCTVTSRTCRTCGQQYFYDGWSDGVLNMGNFLVHHEVLREYMYLYVYGRCTLHAFHQTWLKIQMEEGNGELSKTFLYRHFRLSWYNFVDLLDIDINSGFSCSECGPTPEMVLFDATTLGHRKIYQNWYSFKMKYLERRNVGSSHKDRIFIPDKTTRDLLQSFLSTKETTEDFSTLKERLKIHSPELLPFIHYCEATGTDHSIPQEYHNLMGILSSRYSVCASVHLSAIPVLERLLEDKECLSSAVFLNILHKECPIVFELMSLLKEVPAFLIPIIKKMLVRAQEPFKEATFLSTEAATATEDSNMFYPFAKKLRDRPTYAVDTPKLKTEESMCKKGKDNLLPGIFTMHCQHGNCYGYSIMDSVESPDMAFTVLLTRFETAPNFVIYDNACGLHNYCLNREPYHFRNTWFLVDRLHYRSHKLCSRGYKLADYPQFVKVNSQAVEQSNAAIAKLRTSLTYMNHSHFSSSLKLFLWYRNTHVLQTRIYN
ncbi:uncharacterized protein [Argopecten irradians]|uniref:uncharacterized protein isoform X2 n=1 Tax=Argopecten irradians TaxID=31199 RepID=UPI0037184A9F